MKNSNDIIGNQTRGLPTCNAVPQSTAPQHAVDTEYLKIMYETFTKFKVLLLVFHSTPLI
jgi:hypothetical protein